MTMIEDGARVGGRANIVDVAAVVVLLVLIPAAFGSYLLFRTPPATLTTVSPNRLYPGNQLKIHITGRNLRPFMRVSFNDVQGRSFLIETPESAQVDLPDLAEGVYDVVLYDYRREVSRLTRAFTIMPRSAGPTVQLDLEGVFIGVPAEWSRDIAVGSTFPASKPATAEVLAVGRAAAGHVTLRIGGGALRVPMHETELPATVRVQCAVQSNVDGTVTCGATGTEQAVPIAVDAVLSFAGPRGWLRYQIIAVHGVVASPMAEVRVRFVGTSELLRQIRAGDVDAGPFVADVKRHASVSGLGSIRVLVAGEAGFAGRDGGASHAMDVTLGVPADAVGRDWAYKGVPLKAGAPFTLETPRYIVHGQVISVAALPETPRP